MVKIRNYLGRDLASNRTNDKLTKSERSVLMSKIRSNKTSFEVAFLNILKRLKINFTSHPKNVFGHPDVLIRKNNTYIFLDSDFWHGWQYPRWKHKLKDDRWRLKIERNRERDRHVTYSFHKNGMKILRIWEHTLQNMSDQEIANLIWSLD